MTTWLHDERLDAVVAAVRESGAESVLDLGCGDGACLLRLAPEPAIRRIVGLDLSAEALRALRRRLQEMPAGQRDKVELRQRSFLAPGAGLEGFDMAILVESIEHVDPDRLTEAETAVFKRLSPAAAIITTPNAEFNPLLGVPGHRFRHPDHRFEWGRAKFRAWAEGVAARCGYTVSHRDLGGSHPQLGGASQMALFSRSV